MRTPETLPTVVLLVFAVVIAIFLLAVHIEWVYVMAAVAAILILAALMWFRRTRSVPAKNRFSMTLCGGFVFLLGAVWGFIDSIKEGWHWSDLLPLAFPTVLGAYLVWFAFAHRQSRQR
jgi:CDP-diglyceride synthetase